MLKFFKNFFGKGAEEDSNLSAQVASAAAGLDIDMAIAAHENWKLRLQSYLDGTSKEVFGAEVICFDDRCDLGKWIHGDGKAKLGAFPGFTALMGHHKMFHYAASNVVALAKSGKGKQAQAMLGGQFGQFSQEVVQGLTALKEMAKTAPTAKSAQKTGRA